MPVFVKNRAGLQPNRTQVWSWGDWRQKQFYWPTKKFLEIKCTIVQASEANLKCDAGSATDVTKTDAPYFCNNLLHSLLSDCTVSANGIKFQTQTDIMLTKVSLKPNFLITKKLKQVGWHVKVIHTKRTPGQFQQLKLTDKKLWLNNMPNVFFMES